jgi:cytochrome c oxidase subunit II
VTTDALTAAAATSGRRRRRSLLTGRGAAAAGAAAIVVLLAAGCTEHGLPTPSTEQAEDAADLWRIALIAAAVVGGVTMTLIVWSAIRYRRRSDALPEQGSSHLTFEIVCITIPVAIVAGLFAFTVTTESKVTALSPDPDVVVDVVGYKWGWTFTYPDEGVKSSPGNDGAPAVLAVPVGASVRFNLRSVDVIHSFWVPQFLEKRDLIPGIDNAIEVDVTRTGTWTGRCAEFCGLDHWRMNFEVRALEPADFEAWLGEQRTAETDA